MNCQTQIDDLLPAVRRLAVSRLNDSPQRTVAARALLARRSSSNGAMRVVLHGSAAIANVTSIDSRDRQRFPVDTIRAWARRRAAEAAAA